MGVSDVDPFIMSMTQSAERVTPLTVASTGILIAAASNNLVKGIYAYVISDRPTGLQSLCLLAALAVLGLHRYSGWGDDRDNMNKRPWLRRREKNGNVNELVRHHK